MKQLKSALSLCGLLLAMFALAQPAEARRFRMHFVPSVRHHSETTEPAAEQHQVESAQDVAEREHKIQLIREGKLIERHPGESDADYEQRKESWIKRYRDEADAKAAKAQPSPTKRSSSGLGWGLLALLGFAIFGRKILKAIFSLVQSASSSPSDYSVQDTQPDPAGFDQRVAQRLAETRQGNNLGLASQPRAGGFGRKLA